MEYRVRMMTPEERLARAEDLLQGARKYMTPEELRKLEAIDAEYEAFCDRVDAGEDTLLDPYAAQAPEEFFAVASEAFFVAPQDFRAEHPRVHGLLVTFFRQDPAAHLDRAARER